MLLSGLIDFYWPRRGDIHDVHLSCICLNFLLMNMSALLLFLSSLVLKK